MTVLGSDKKKKYYRYLKDGKQGCLRVIRFTLMKIQNCSHKVIQWGKAKTKKLKSKSVSKEIKYINGQITN